ncbi:EmrB/QacA subfamily drug resistance transporter [Salsuginibacillus halophilus]|uniref:EmrB/QacA subfamily drug resistance transporter n=1 Tax=Salsuginibacillus halophilus TaxID=517424 RepID=A0A2P8HL38_9BACI|nr:MDR family MFS transporter [Salsuginibacillus halophilus]PSL46937.1 EmrB/QacA subfamily drug resistance transporter [Salsuginibacillus halophilus]
MKRIPGKWLVVVSLLLGTFTLILNNSMLNPAVPHLMEVFDADAVATGWVITIFMVSMGMTMPVTGFLGDKFGKKRLYLIGLSLFVLGSLLGSFAWDLSSLIMFRALQGIGGGIMMPLSMALIFAAFPRNERGLATGTWGVAAMVAPTIGPTLGGTIIELASWPWLFLINVPFGLVALFVAWYYLKEVETDRSLQFDRYGFIFVTLGVGAILFALGNISEFEHLTDMTNLGLIAFGVVALYVFVRIENQVAHPLLDLSILKIGAYALSIWVTALSSIGLFAGIFLVPLLVQNVYGYDAIMTGLVFVPSALLTGVFMSIGGRLLDAGYAPQLLAAGMTVAAGGTIAMGFFTIETAIYWVFILMGIRGMGMGCFSMPATTAGMNAIPEAVISRGSAMNNVFRQMFSALGIVFVSIYFEVRRAQLFAGNGGEMQEASLQAINEAFIIIGLLTLFSVPTGFMLGRKAKQSEQEKQQEEEAEN